MFWPNVLFGSAAVQFPVVLHYFVLQLFFLSIQLIDFVPVTHKHTQSHVNIYSSETYCKINNSRLNKSTSMRLTHTIWKRKFLPKENYQPSY